MKFKDNLPIYLQIEDYINLQIAQGKLQAGEKLPSVRALALELTVNANTVQRALREMTAKGYIFTKRGEGNFVTTDEGRLQEMKSKAGAGGFRQPDGETRSRKGKPDWTIGQLLR